MNKLKDSTKIVRLSIAIPEQVRKELKACASFDGYEMKEVVLKLILEYIDKNKLMKRNK